MYLHAKFVWESTWLGMWLVRGVVAVGVFERGGPEPSRKPRLQEIAKSNEMQNYKPQGETPYCGGRS
jgi:hypothetical protein